MTERLYYHDSFLREFDARVVACSPVDGKFRVTLDRTAFYPTSGGQPHDTGALDGAQILDVQDDDAGGVAHFTDRALASGGAVHGAIDWSRRFDHMQQHTGQHILSAAFVSLFQLQTVSFHLGRESSTIDLAARALDDRQLEEAERVANQVIFDDVPVGIRFVAPQELAALGVRKEVKREGEVRVISIGDFDRQPCGGTHVARSGQIGALLLRKVEKQKQNWRVEFVCGGRALRVARSDYAALGEAAAALSVGRAEVPVAVRKVLEERATLNRQREQLQEQLIDLHVAGIVSAQLPVGIRTHADNIVEVFAEGDASYLRAMATRIAKLGLVRVFLASESSRHVVLTQSAGLDGDMNALLREWLAAAGGKGGGTRDFAQGSVPTDDALLQIIQRAQARLRKVTP